MAIRTTITFPPNAITAFRRYDEHKFANIRLGTIPSKDSCTWPMPDALDIDFHAIIKAMDAFTVFDEPHIAIASPKRWHVRQKRATCLRLKAGRD